MELDGEMTGLVALARECGRMRRADSERILASVNTIASFLGPADAESLVSLVTNSVKRAQDEKKASPMNMTVRTGQAQIRREQWLAGSEIVVAIGEGEYRESVSRLLKPSDGVIELGCHCGVTTAQIADFGCSPVVGVDTSEFNIEKAKNERGERVHFIRADAYDMAAVRDVVAQAVGAPRIRSQEYSESGGDEEGDHDPSSKKLVDEATRGAISVVYIDVSGNRPPGVVLELMERYHRSFSPRLFVIKNFKLAAIIRNAVLFSDLCQSAS